MYGPSTSPLHLCDKSLQMIRQSVAESLVQMLNISDASLESISNKFNQEFDFNDRLTALTGISLLLTDGLLSFPQQIVGVWILYNEFKNQPIKSHPFGAIFNTIFLAQQTSPFVSPQLKDILVSIISGNGFSGAEKESVKTILASGFKFPKMSDPGIERSPNPIVRISPVIVSNQPDPTAEQLTHDQVLLKILQNAAFWSNYDAPLIRPSPDISPIFPDELSPIESYNSPEFLWDAATNSGTKNLSIMLLAKAADNKLKQQQINSLIAEFNKDTSIFDENQFPQNKFASLIENNVELAKEIVAKIGARKPQILKQLQSLDVTVNSIDVVKNFMLFGNPPADFLQGYARNSIKLIQGIKEVQNSVRKTRIFSKFMGLLISNGKPFTEGLVNDLKQFCNEMASKNIKETRELLEQLDHVEIQNA